MAQNSEDKDEREEEEEEKEEVGEGGKWKRRRGRKQASILCGQRLGGGGRTSESLHLLDRGFQSCKTVGEMQGGGKELTPQSKQAFTIQVEAAESLAASSGVSRFGH